MSLRLAPKAERGLLVALPLVAVACLALIAWGDLPAARLAHTLSPGLHQVFRRLSMPGNSAYSLIPFFLLFAGLQLAARRAPGTPQGERRVQQARVFLFLFVAVAVSGLACDLVKFLFGRARPKMLFGHGLYGFSFFQLSGKMTSFPSGHTNTAFALATALFLLAPRWGWLYFPLALVVGASRVLVGAHYPSDVLAGGYLAVVVTLYVQQYFLSRGVRIFARRS